MHTKTLIAAFAALMFAGCNTMEGVGKDLQKAGEKLEGAAASKKDDKSKADVPPPPSADQPAEKQ